MVTWIFLLLGTMNMIMSGKSQIYTCPNEEGLFYTTDPECLIYYRCENRMLTNGVCFPWNRFDIHTLTCTQQDEVDCNSKYAGIWRPVYGTEPQDGEGSGEVQGEDSGVAEEEVVEETVTEEVANNTAKANEEVQGVEKEEEIADEKAVAEKEGTEENVVVMEDKEILNKSEAANVNTQLNAIDKNIEVQSAGNVEEDKTGAEGDHGENQTEPQSANITDFVIYDEGTEMISDEGIQNTSTSELPFANFDKTEISETIREGSFENINAEETNCCAQDNAAYDVITSKQLQDTTSEETKQEVSSASFLFWCGSGRIVTVQSYEDAYAACLELQDPEYIYQESSSQEAGDGAGHTYLGTDTSPFFT